MPCVRIGLFVVLILGGCTPEVSPPEEPARNELSSPDTATGEAPQGPYLIHQITIDPQNSDNLYAATSHYGILKSRDGGRHWKLINQGMKSYTHHQVVVHPKDPAILYAGGWGGGVSKSLDGGETWTEVNQGLGNTAVNKIVLHPGNPEEVYVVTGSGVYRSLNGGALWEDFNRGLNRNHEESFHDILILPDQTHALYLGSSRGVYRRDGPGGKWLILDQAPRERVTALAYHVAEQRLFAGTLGAGLYMNRPMEKEWQPAPGTEFTWIRQIVLDPVNLNTLYLATKDHGVLRSEDLGRHWVARNQGLPDLHVQSLSMDPARPRVLYAGTYEDGIFISLDGGLQWVRAGHMPRRTITEILKALPWDEDMRGAAEVRGLIDSPLQAAQAFQSGDSQAIPPAQFAKCNECHGWTDPLLNLRRTYWRVPANIRDWDYTVRQRMSQRAKLTREEEEIIIQFLDRYSTLQEGLSGSHLPPLSGETPPQVVQRVCSRCHDLEINHVCVAGDCQKARTHRTTGRQWSFVVDWMRIMGAKMSDLEQQTIVEHLVKTFPAEPYPLEWEKMVTLPGQGWNIVSLRTLGDHLYAGTEGSGMIFRSRDGRIWDEVARTGTYRVYGITEFKKSYFAGASSPRPEIWKSKDGADWTKQAILPADQSGVISLGTFRGHLYAGTARGRIFRSEDGAVWEEVAVFEQSERPHWVRALIGFGDRLYAITEMGLIYRSKDGHAWEEVGAPVRGKRNYFGLRGATEFRGYLYVGSITHGEIWRSSDGLEWERVLDVMLRQKDGGQALQTGGYVASLAVYDHSIYAAIRTHSGFVFRSRDGEQWEEVANLSPHSIEALAVFKGQIYAGTLIPPRGTIYRGIGKKVPFDGKSATQKIPSPSTHQ